jgi:predicted AAA+ superfamily ATPase
MKDRDLLLSYISTRLREGPIFAEENIHRENKRLNSRKVLLKLKKHIDEFLKGNIENRFIIMPGLRGVGKTTLIFQLYDYLLNQLGIENDRILYISADQIKEFLDETIMDTIEVFITDIHKRSFITLEEKIFIFVDEAQYDEKWSETGKILYDQSKKIFMIFTGSSALNLETNIDAVRRAKKESIFPLNFQEYLMLKHDINAPKGSSDILRDMILTGDINEASKIGKKINQTLSKLKTPPIKEWENYLCYGGFQISIYLNEIDINEKTYNMIERIIEKDVTHYKSIRNGTKSIIFKIITFLALQKPGELSKVKLAKKIGVSSSIIQEMLDILEKTHLIFHLNPYAGAGKIIRKPWKYYFLSPSIKSSINFSLGKYTPENREFLGILAENLIASTFFQMKETINKPNGIFYPPDAGSVDFLLNKVGGDIIPVEVGIGKKDKKQVKKAMDKYNSDYGIIISEKTPIIKKEEDIINLPLTTFSFI